MNRETERENEKKQLANLHTSVEYPVIHAAMRYIRFTSPFPCFNELKLFPHFLFSTFSRCSSLRTISRINER